MFASPAVLRHFSMTLILFRRRAKFLFGHNRRNARSVDHVGLAQPQRYRLVTVA